MMPPRQRFRMVVPVYPAFNIYSRIARQTAALGPLCVATAVSRRPGWDVEVIDENNYRTYGPRDATGRPDHATLQAIRPAGWVGLYGGLSSTIPRLHELARFYHVAGVRVVAGGQHFTGENIRAALEQGVDVVVLGEGEGTIVELLAAVEAGRPLDGVAGIAFLRDGEVVHTPERPPITDFDAQPLPDFGLVRYARIRLYPVGWTRGCGMNCEFCTVRGVPRSASTGRILEQIAALVEGRHARRFFIVDDLFGQDRAQTLQLCDKLATYQEAVGRRLQLTVQIRLDRGHDAELLRAMRRAGVRAVCIGFESPIEAELTAMDKKIRPAQMLELTRNFHRAGFLVHGMFIFGYPLQPGCELQMDVRQRVRQFRDFIRKSRIDTIQVLLPVPLPGTDLRERLAAANRVFPQDCIGWEYYDGNFPLFMPDAPLTPEEMQWATRAIMGRFYCFREVFAIVRNVLVFPAILLSPWNLRLGWRIWFRAWRNDLLRFGGWITLQRWVSLLRHGPFLPALARAKQAVHADASGR